MVTGFGVYILSKCNTVWKLWNSIRKKTRDMTEKGVPKIVGDINAKKSEINFSASDFNNLGLA